MTYHDPFGGPPSSPQPGPTGFPPSAPASNEVNTLATLSIIFAFVFAPVGAVLGHLALSQIAQRGERGKERAIIGLTLSYILLVAAIIGLVAWLLFGGDSESEDTQRTDSAATTSAVPAAPPPQTTVITAPPTQRPTVDIEELQVGDCVEVQQNYPDPNNPSLNAIFVYRTACEVRDGVVQVVQVLGNDACRTRTTLQNETETHFACVDDYRGGPHA